MSQMDVECWKEKRDMEPFMAHASGISVRSALHGIPSLECRTCAAILLWSYGLPDALGAHGGVSQQRVQATLAAPIYD